MSDGAFTKLKLQERVDRCMKLFRQSPESLSVNENEASELSELHHLCLERAYEEKDQEAMGNVLNWLFEKEPLWTEAGYSDGFYTYTRLQQYADKAIRDGALEFTAFLLDYKASHFDDFFTMDAESNEMDITFGLKTRPAAYFQRGETIPFGSYVHSSEEHPEKDPIEWTVLTQKDGKLLLIARYGLEAIPYHETPEPVTWEMSSVRAWLNGEFLHSVFTEEERNQILMTPTPNPANSKFETPGGNDTADRIFLLNEDEAETLFDDAKERLCKATPYARRYGTWAKGMYYCWWWLRSPGYSRECAAYVDKYGAIHPGGSPADSMRRCVRPAMWIDLNL